MDNDNYQAAKDVVTYLIRLNHQRIAYVGGDHERTVNTERLRGYQDALREAHLPLSDEYVVREPFTLENMRTLLQVSPPPTAMIVNDDLVAMAVQKMLSQLGVSMPEQLSMVSFNNLMLAELMNPLLLP